MVSTSGGNIREPESKVSLGPLAATFLGVLATVAFGSVSPDAMAQAATLRAPSEFSNIGDERVRSQALFTEAGKVLLDPRCLNCHPKDLHPSQGHALHPHMAPMAAALSRGGGRGPEPVARYQKTQTTTSPKRLP